MRDADGDRGEEYGGCGVGHEHAQDCGEHEDCCKDDVGSCSACYGGECACGDVYSARAFEGERERQHADDEDDCFPVDAAVCAVEVYAACCAHDEAADECGLHVWDDAGDHEDDDDGECEECLD